MRQLHVAEKTWAPLLLLLHTRAEPPPPQSVLGLGWRTLDTAQPAVRRASFVCVHVCFELLSMHSQLKDMDFAARGCCDLAQGSCWPGRTLHVVASRSALIEGV
jgi:hypothetical protein